MKRFTKLFCVFAICFWGLSSPMAWSCTACKENLDNASKTEDGTKANLGRAYSISVLCMLIAPFSIVGAGFFLANRYSKKFSNKS
jgi:hypothetical protein